MTSSTLTAASSTRPVDRDRIMTTLTTAFSSDPLVRWLYPDAGGYLAAFPEVLQVVGGAAFLADTADQAADYAGAALWVPPGIEPDDDAAAELLQRTIEPQHQGGAFELLEKMSRHHPTEACWYLPFIGVDPAHQGRGHGSTLLREGVARCDRDGLPAYLEATSPRNRALYERHGFFVVGEIVAGDSPPLWPMLRTAR